MTCFGLKSRTAWRRIEGVGGRKVIEAAALRWGFMEGERLALFAPTPTAGLVKLPDLSLALGFEHRLGLEGNAAKVGKMIQTARIRPLKDAVAAVRWSTDVALSAKRISHHRRGADDSRVEFMPDSIRIVRDGERYYFMAIDRHTMHRYGRDFIYDGAENSVAVEAFHFVSESGARSRQDVYLVREEYDHNKMMAMAMDGRIHLYSLDVGASKEWFDAAYSVENTRPCKIVTTIPQFVVGGEVRITFIVNPQLRRDGRKMAGRSWTSYTDAYPDEAKRNCVCWPDGSNTTLREAIGKVVETDGVLLTDDEHLGEALNGMGYVMPNGYSLQDRVFFAREREEGKVDKWHKARIGKPLVEVIAKGSLKAAEKEFEAAIVSDKLADKKTAKFFTLEAPIEIGETYKAMVAREFRRIVFTGTMGWRRQLIRPAHEVALGIWLARLRERD